MSWGRFWGAAAVLATTGCSCPGPSGKTECGDFAPVVDAWCGALERCPQTLPLATSTRSECVDLGCFLFTCAVTHDDVRGEHRDAVVARAPTHSAARRDACVAWLAAARCDALEPFNPPAFGPRPGGVREATPCDGLLAPVDPVALGAGPGAQCTVDACAPGLDCAPAQVNRATAVRRCEACRAQPAEGEACSALDGGCGMGLTCQTYLTARTCVPPFAEGASCTTATQCASGACDPVGRVCIPRKAVGAICQRGDECSSGVCELGARVCAPGCRASTDCAEGEWCDAVAHRCHGVSSDGESCSAHVQCNSGFCGADGKCAAAGAGEPACGSSGKVCRLPLECHDGNCQPMALACRPRSVGESCRALGVCDGASTCDTASWQCLPRQPQGAACSRPDLCLERLACVGGVCAAPSTAGAVCVGSSECAAGLRCEVDPRSGTPVCAAEPTGLPCGKTSACPSTHFCSAAGRCAVRGVEGQACSVTAPCLESLYCEQGTVCRARRDAGESCGPFVGCGSGLRCGDGGSCEAAAGVGVACAVDESGKCLPNLYCDSFAASPVCAAQLGEAQACTRDSQCPSGACEPSFGCLATAACVLQ